MILSQRSLTALAQAGAMNAYHVCRTFHFEICIMVRQHLTGTDTMHTFTIYNQITSCISVACTAFAKDKRGGGVRFVGGGAAEDDKGLPARV